MGKQREYQKQNTSNAENSKANIFLYNILLKIITKKVKRHYFYLRNEKCMMLKGLETPMLAKGLYKGFIFNLPIRFSLKNRLRHLVGQNFKSFSRQTADNKLNYKAFESID